MMERKKMAMMLGPKTKQDTGYTESVEDDGTSEMLEILEAFAEAENYMSFDNIFDYNFDN